MLSPAFDQRLRLLQAVEDLSVQEFISERPIEAFIIAIFPDHVNSNALLGGTKRGVIV